MSLTKSTGELRPPPQPGETNMTMKLYGLENAANWGWDWFATIDEARDAWKHNRKTYGHNDKPWVLTSDQVKARNL